MRRNSPTTTAAKFFVWRARDLPSTLAPVLLLFLCPGAADRSNRSRSPRYRQQRVAIERQQPFDRERVDIRRQILWGEG